MIQKQDFKEHIVNRDLEEEVKESYLCYAMSVIVGRALPDVRDGLKPVQRRILYVMHELHLRHNQAHRKCARITGECLGKYHPHGDVAVYDALVRMGQDFTLRYPLIDAQGNFGSIDGDPPAAMRYTEARLSRISDYLLADIEKDTVNFFPNFDNSLKEPEVLPTIVPNLLLNGSSGIAVGMATNIPPHNLNEVCDALIYVLDRPDCTIKDLNKIIKGPDFPTGGIICGKEGIIDAYKKGKGKIIVRARATIERQKGKPQIVITEIPYQLNKSNLIESIANLVNNKKIDGITDLRDESDKEGIRIVIELKRDSQPEIILNQLYKHTYLETTFGIIMLALVNRRPQILNLKEMLVQHIHHRKEVIVRRTKFELDKAQRRAHILEGLKIALRYLDEVVDIIKKARDPKDAKYKLMKKFSLTELQTQAILEMQLQRLCALERKKLEQEYLELIKKIELFKLILASEKKQEEMIKEELKTLKKEFGDERRTEIVGQREEIEIEDLIVEEDMVITVSQQGYIKRQPLTSYRRQNRGGRGVTAADLKDTDFIQHIFISSSKDILLIFTNSGKVYSLKTYEIPAGSRVSRGRALVNLLKLGKNEFVTGILSIKDFSADQYIFMVTNKGLVKRTASDLFANIRKSGIIAIGLDKNNWLVSAGVCSPEDEAVLITKKGMVIRFKVNDIRPTGRLSQGVRGIKLSSNDEVVSMILIHKNLLKRDLHILTATEKGFGKRTHIKDYKRQTRGGKGILNIKHSSKIGNIIGAILVQEEDGVVCITQKGILIRLQVKDIRLSGRVTQGVRIINLGRDDALASIARIAVTDAE